MVTGKEIAERLNAHSTSIQKAGFGMTQVVDRAALIQFLSGRRKAAGAWKPEKAALADEWYCELTGEQPMDAAPQRIKTANTSLEVFNEGGSAVRKQATLTISKPTTTIPSQKPDNPQPGENLTASRNFLRSGGFASSMLVVAIVAQTLHTATFFYFITPVPDSILRYVTAGVVGIGVDAAALVATIQSQRKWYLWVFAVIHFGINMSAHFRFADNFGDLDTTTYHFWFDSALLSGAVAFAVYCYSNVFAFNGLAQGKETRNA